jgi:hypothetical protein
MTTSGDIHKKRGIQVMKIGAAMLVFGIAIALAFSYGQDEPHPLGGLGMVSAIAGFITAIVGLGKWRETPAND